MDILKAPFITFEGGEGCGKSTQLNILYQRLLAMGLKIKAYREPGGTEGAETIRALLLHGEEKKWPPLTEALLMSAARADLIEKHILPQLTQETWVICDRFTDSTLAYQGFGHGLGYEAITALNHFTVGTLIPDLTFIFQLDSEIGLERTAEREAGKDRYEQLDLSFHKRVAKGYEEILQKNPDRCVAINAGRDIEDISEIIFAEVSKKFKDRFSVL